MKLEPKKSEWPDVGDFVVATVVSITRYGAYVRLDEYDKEGLLHVSEVASRWVRNIRNFVREKQKVVLKVLRVNTEKGHVDLSLRRVTKRDRKEKILIWKKERKAYSLLRSVSEKLNVSAEEIYQKAGAPIENEFGGLHEGLEKIAKEGASVLSKLEIPSNIATVLEEVTKEKIKISLVEVKGILELRSMKPNGATIIKEALLHAQKIGESHGTNVHIYLVTPPRYRVIVSAEDYKSAEKTLEEATATALAQNGIEGTFNRER